MGRVAAMRARTSAWMSLPTSHAVLICAVLICAVLIRAVLFYAILSYAVASVASALPQQVYHSPSSGWNFAQKSIGPL